ncbi:uncharacterized protein AKAME5_001896800 [Lates japonicus]|uniref:Uncharacterized protein n=1 Tax=Lates japonicus TaxID=270547 RepID=A0AAD3N4L9_LATJO|nr:uncharacterized protein AKAME5_001896800 [Lates japonicus]
MSPEKKRITETTLISKDDLDVAILKGVSKALQEQQQNFYASVALAVKDALESVLIPQLTSLKDEISSANEAIRKLAADLEHHTSKAQRTLATVDSLQAAFRSNKHDLNDVTIKLVHLQNSLTEMQDRSRRNNLRLINLPESAKGSDPVVYLQANLPRWIPSLAGHIIEIDHCHLIYDCNIGKSGSEEKPRTIIFRLLRCSD